MKIIGSKLVMQRVSTLLYFVISSFVLLNLSCVNPKEESLAEDYIEIYFLKGFVDAQIDCSRNFSITEADSLGDVIISEKNYAQVLNLVGKLQENPEWMSCNMDLQSNIYSNKDERKRVCISRFNCMISDNTHVFANDSLAYLLRDYSGYYNYFDKESLSIFKELKTVGPPSNYVDLSETDDSSIKSTARMIIRRGKISE